MVMERNINIGIGIDISIFDRISICFL